MFHNGKCCIWFFLCSVNVREARGRDGYSMTECELSSFTFALLGLWGEANKPRDLSASDFTIFAGFGVTKTRLTSLLHWSLQTSAFLVLWLGYTDTAVKFSSDAIELHGCLLHESQYLKQEITYFLSSLHSIHI